jgi:hypothetical protein
VKLGSVIDPLLNGTVFGAGNKRIGSVLAVQVAIKVAYIAGAIPSVIQTLDPKSVVEIKAGASQCAILIAHASETRAQITTEGYLRLLTEDDAAGAGRHLCHVQ